MPTNIVSFNAQVSDFGKTLLPREFVVFHRKIGLEALSRIVEKNPVDTGRSRGNWQTDIDQTNEAEVLSVDPTGAGSGRLAGLQPFQTIFIFNNVSYIEFLEEGSSSQAPAGMVAVTLAELSVIFP